MNQMPRVLALKAVVSYILAIALSGLATVGIAPRLAWLFDGNGFEIILGGAALIFCICAGFVLFLPFTVRIWTRSRSEALKMIYMGEASVDAGLLTRIWNGWESLFLRILFSRE